MPFVVAGLMMVAYSLMIRSDFVARGQARLFRLDGGSADRRRAVLWRTSQVSLSLGLVALLVGSTLVALGTSRFGRGSGRRLLTHQNPFLTPRICRSALADDLLEMACSRR